MLDYAHHLLDSNILPNSIDNIDHVADYNVANRSEHNSTDTANDLVFVVDCSNGLSDELVHANYRQDHTIDVTVEPSEFCLDSNFDHSFNADLCAQLAYCLRINNNTWAS